MELLVRGITGFWSDKEMLGPGISAEKFKKLVYTIANNNQLSVVCTDSGLTGKNFYWAACEKYGNLIFILMNSRYPYLAFATRIRFSSVHFIDPLEDLILPQADKLIIMEKGLLNQPWQNQENTLDEAELSQIRCWRPMTIGEIIFNFWD